MRWPRPLLSVCDVAQSERGRECVGRVRGLCGCEKWGGFDWEHAEREGQRERERCGREEGTGMIGQCMDFSYRWGEVEDVRCF